MVLILNNFKSRMKVTKNKIFSLLVSFFFLYKYPQFFLLRNSSEKNLRKIQR